MTTATNTAVLNHTTTAEFRVWGSAFKAILGASGLIQTADTGQIDWTTVTLPAPNAVGGYEIWRFNDTLQGTTPIFLKVEYGTATNTNRPGMWLTVASGSNGSGTLNGTTYLNRVSVSPAATAVSSTYPLYACHTDGFFGVTAFRRFAGGSHSFCFMICRTVDAAGTITATGIITYVGSTALSRYTYMNGVLYGAAGGFCSIPGTPTNTIVGGNVQLFRHFAMQPEIICVPQVLSYYGTEIPTETTFTATPIGVTARTYLAMSDAGGPQTTADGGLGTGNRMAMLWE